MLQMCLRSPCTSLIELCIFFFLKKIENHCPRVWLMLHWKTLVFLFQQINYKNFWVRSVTLCQLSVLVLGFCVVWTFAGLVHPTTVSVSSYVHLSCGAGKTVSLELSTTASLYDLSSFSPFFLLLFLLPYGSLSLRGGFNEDISLRADCSKVSHSLPSCEFPC